jgi:hypothetical protein
MLRRFGRKIAHWRRHLTAGACSPRDKRAIHPGIRTMSDDFFAPPPFDPASALATLKRTLRDLKFVERGGAFEFNGQPAVRARVDGAVLALDVAKRPSRSPDWEHAEARDHGVLRKFTDDLKKRVARWADARGDD